MGVIYGSPEVTAGGNALKFYSSIRLDTRRKEILPDNAGIRVKVKVVKNKIAAPFRIVNLDILFGTGIDSYGCMLDCAMDLNIIERKGSWYALNGQNLAQGRHNCVELLKNNAELAEQLETAVRQALDDMVQKPDAPSKNQDASALPDMDGISEAAFEGVESDASDSFN